MRAPLRGSDPSEVSRAVNGDMNERIPRMFEPNSFNGQFHECEEACLRASN